jgi:hypothetical protein
VGIPKARPQSRGLKTPLTLNFGKSSLIGRSQKPAASVGDDDPPAVFLIGDDSQRRAGAEASKVQQLLRDEPTQIDARNALLSHLGARDTLRHFLVFSPSRSAGGQSIQSQPKGEGRPSSSFPMLGKSSASEAVRLLPFCPVLEAKRR